MEAAVDSVEGIVEMTINVTCDEQGISAPEFGIVGLPFGAEVRSIRAEGVVLVPVDQLVEGATWEALIEVESEMEGGIAVTIERRTMYTVLGFEEIDTRAGTFDALRVRSEFMLDIDLGGRLISTAGASDTWFVEGLGIAKEAEFVDGGNPRYGLELVDFSIP